MNVVCPGHLLPCTSGLFSSVDRVYLNSATSAILEKLTRHSRGIIYACAICAYGLSCGSIAGSLLECTLEPGSLLRASY